MTLAPRPHDPDARNLQHPWGPLAALWVTGSFSLALVLILAGYVVTSGTLQIRGQLTGVNIALAAVVLELASGIAWTTRGYRTVRERQRLLVSELSAVLGADAATPAPVAVPAAAGRAPSTTSVVVRQGTVHHLSTCPLAVGKVIALAGERARSGRPACRVCQP